jgi:uncharacterized protein (TIGR02246 family)
MSRREIEAREQEWLAAFNAGDAAGVAGLYAEDGRLMPPSSDVIQGRDGIAAFAATYIAMGARGAFSLITVHESPDLCVAVGRYEMEVRPDGGEPARDLGKYVEVWARQGDGSWLMVDDIFNSSLPAPAQ